VTWSFFFVPAAHRTRFFPPPGKIGLTKGKDFAAVSLPMTFAPRPVEPTALGVVGVALILISLKKKQLRNNFDARGA